MSRPPERLDGARVMWWAWAGDRPFGEVYGAPEERRWVWGMAVCRYEGGEVYRFSCNEKWEVVQDSDHANEEEAKAGVPGNYDDSRVRWVRFDAAR